MLLSPSIILKAILLVGALVWCKDVVRRSPDDILALRTSDEFGEKFAVVFWWVIASFVGWWAVVSVLGLIHRISMAF